MRETSTVITRYNIAELACKAHIKALCPETVQSGFRRTGIFPFNPESLTPAKVYHCQNDTDLHETVEGGIVIDKGCALFKVKENRPKTIKSECQIALLSSLLNGHNVMV